MKNGTQTGTKGSTYFIKSWILLFSKHAIQVTSMKRKLFLNFASVGCSNTNSITRNFRMEICRKVPYFQPKLSTSLPFAAQYLFIGPLHLHAHSVAALYNVEFMGCNTVLLILRSNDNFMVIEILQTKFSFSRITQHNKRFPYWAYCHK